MNFKTLRDQQRDYSFQKEELKEKRIAIFEWVRAYLGFGFLAWWGIWCGLNNYAIVSNFTGFITSLGGILG
jgi:hypothetical protein